MTTPNAEGFTSPGLGGLLGGIVGGTSGSNNYNVGGGTLGGTNPLQQSIDTLTNAVSRLNSTLGTLNWGGGQPSGNAQQQQGGGGFNRPVNPFMNNPPTGGIGGGGPGGTGNVRQPQPFGYSNAGNGGYAPARYTALGALTASITGFGQQQMPIQLALNAYAAQTRLGMPTGTGFPRAQSVAFNQSIGYGNSNLNALAINPQDAVGMAQALQYAGGAANYRNTPIGRGAYGSTAAFGITNPLLSATSAAGLSQQIYNPSLSYKMLSLGYPSTPRVLGGGATNSATFAQSLFRAWNGGKTNINPSTLNASLAQGGRANLNLQALGLNPQQMTPFLQGYNQLFRQGLSANQAQSLFTAAGQNKPGAQSRLEQLGVSTTDIQKIKNNQATLAGRDATYANAFNSALSVATTGLQDFNKALTAILQHTGLSNVIGGAGGFLGTLAGTNSINSALGIGGAFALGRGFLARAGGGAAASAAGSAASGAGGGILGRILGGLGGAGAAGGGGGILSGLGGGALAGGVAAGGATIGGLGLLFNALRVRAKSTGWGGAFLEDPRDLAHDPAFTGRFGPVNAGYGNPATPRSGGAGSPSQPRTSQQRKSSGGKQMSGNSSGSAMQAIQAAESQLGVPYEWGGENPGVGFDCSGLVQWAYKQAGVNLPRTSQDQWASLQKRAVDLNKVQGGDLVFAGGSDGTASSPGHVGMMISNSSLIQAPHSGANVELTAYTPKDWQHAARPSGRGGGIIGGSTPGSASKLPGLAGNSGLGMSGSYGSVEEIDAITSALGGMGGGMANQTGFGAAGSGKGSRTNTNGKTTKGLAGNKKIMNMIASRWGWGSGQEWTALNQLEMHEAGYDNLAQNPTSTAYGMGQFLDTTWATVGGHKTSDPKIQSELMMKYIKQRYGDPQKAWSQYYQHPGGIGWYGAGTGNMRDNISVVGDRGPEILIGGAGSQVLDNKQTMNILKAIQAQPQQTPWSSLDNLGSATQSTGAHHGPTLNINFNKDAIAIRIDGNTPNTESVGRATAKSIMRHISDEKLLQDIMKGNKNG